MKKPVSRRALEARVRRALEKDGEFLRRSRPDSRWWNDLGEYYVVNERNNIVAQHQELVPLAREMGLLKPGEEMRD